MRLSADSSAGHRDDERPRTLTGRARG
jgi:hypothetical protein